MEELLSFLNSIALSGGRPLSPECLDCLRAVIKNTTVKKEEYLLSAGQVCANIYFIRSGLLKCFYMLRDKKVSDWFFGPNETVVSIDSFYDQTPGIDYMQALKDSRLFYISYEEYDHLFRTFVEFNVVGRILTNKYLRVWHVHARNIRRLTKYERYLYLLEHQPDLINDVPVQDVASYLDMAPATLSRMRGRIVNPSRSTRRRSDIPGRK